MAHRLKAARVIITGGTSGIGLSIVQTLLKDTGVASVGVLGRDSTALKALSSSPWADGKLYTEELDLKNITKIKSAVDKLASKMHGFDVLISNAGMMTTGLNVTNCSIEAWQQEIDVNLTAPFLLTQAATPHLKRSSRAAIVHVSSICSTVAFENLLPYCSAKAGLDQLTRCSALELGPHGIRVNAVNPGIIDTPLNRKAFTTDEQYAKYLSESSALHPVRRCGIPSDVADLVAFLADSKASGFITGQMHTIDGGRTLPAPSLQFAAKEDDDSQNKDNECSLQSKDEESECNFPNFKRSRELAFGNDDTAAAHSGSMPVKLGRLDSNSPYGTPFPERSVASAVILITGAARGIGAALAAALCKRGAKVLIADRMQRDLETTARSVGASGAFVYDQTDLASIKSMFEEIQKRFGYLDVLVANAGVMTGLGVDISDTDDELESMNWRVNAEGCSQIVKYALPLLFNQDADSDFQRTVVFIGSSSARLNHPDPGYGALSYRGSRTAVNGMMVALHSLYCDDNGPAEQLRQGRKLHRVVSGDPGYVASALGSDDPKTRGLSKMTSEELMKYKEQDGAQTVEQGADTLLYLICAEALPENGKMYYQRQPTNF